MALAKYISEFFLNRAVATENLVLNVQLEWLVALGFIGTTTWLIGRRFALVAKPDRPYISPLIRYSGKICKYIGMIILSQS